MLMYGWMKFVEFAPERYDWAVTVMTAGHLDKAKDRIAENIRTGDRVLDVGCGTGTLALRCLRRGAKVTGLDCSRFMLAQAEKRAREAGYASEMSLVWDSVTQMSKHFADETFDVVTSTMTLGEFPREYLDFILRDCWRVLKPEGRLMIADEVWPEKPVSLFFYRIGLALCWIPQFLLLRRAFFPIKNLESTIQSASFTITAREKWLGSSLHLVLARKGTAENLEFTESSVTRPAGVCASPAPGHLPGTAT